MKTWVVVASKDHVDRAVREGFIQANHGKANLLKRMVEGDMVTCYSPRREFNGKDKLQEFTAIGRVIDGKIHECVEDGEIFNRMNVNYFKSSSVPISSIFSKLSFVKKQKNWGVLFFRGHFEIPTPDFDVIFTAMLPPKPTSCSNEFSEKGYRIENFENDHNIRLEIAVDQRKKKSDSDTKKDF